MRERGCLGAEAWVDPEGEKGGQIAWWLYMTLAKTIKIVCICCIIKPVTRHGADN